MVKIGVIAPDRHIYEKIQPLAAVLGLAENTRFFHSALHDAVPIARTLEREGFDVIVSRGSTAELIQHSGVRTPVVNIPLSIHDISTMLLEAKKLTGLSQPRIAVITYARLDLDIQAFSKLLGSDIHAYHSSHTRAAIKKAAILAVKDGSHIIVGGVNTEYAVRNLDILFMQYVSSPPSLRQALLEAKRIADARHLEQEQSQRFKAVVEVSRDAVVALDAEGRVRMLSPSAPQMLGLPQDALGQSFLDMCPLRDLASCMEKQSCLRDELVRIKGQSLLASIVPTLVQDKVTGAILSFQKAGDIVALESKIRRDLFAKGHVATHTFDSISGCSLQMAVTRERAAHYARTNGTVLLTGETGTGKELFAQAMHNESPRRRGPFVAINCAALPPSLLESELFGYEEGAFTGAIRKGKAGLFELAHQGTIFLDEVSGMDHYGQTRLLRVLQERSVLRLGGDAYLPVDFRVIAATNVDLWSLVCSGAFREDLFFRLNELPLTIPPLRKRDGDIARLATHFAQKPQENNPVTLTASAVRALENYRWPGNVRELRNVVQRLRLLRQGARLRAADIIDALGGCYSLYTAAPLAHPNLGQPPSAEGGSFAVSFPATSAAAKGEVERQRIVQVLQECGGCQVKAAGLLAINKSTLYRKMKRLGIRKTVG